MVRSQCGKKSTGSRRPPSTSTNLLWIHSKGLTSSTKNALSPIRAEIEKLISQAAATASAANGQLASHGGGPAVSQATVPPASRFTAAARSPPPTDDAS